MVVLLQPSAAQDLKYLNDAVLKGEDGGNEDGKFDPEMLMEALLPVRVNEQRVTNLLQSIPSQEPYINTLHQ